MAKNIRQINIMNRTELHTALADYFGVAAGQVTRAFSSGQTEHLRSVLSVGLNGRLVERQTLLTGAGFTMISAVMLEPAVYCAVFGAAATIGIYAAQRISRWRMDQSFHRCLRILDHRQPIHK